MEYLSQYPYGLIVFVVTLCSLFGIYYYFRFKMGYRAGENFWKEATSKKINLATHVPSQEELSAYNVEYNPTKIKKKLVDLKQKLNTVPLTEPLGDAAIIGSSFALTAISASPKLFKKAVESFADKSFNSSADLGSYLSSLKEDSWYSFASASLKDGTFNTLKGHLGERVLGNQLTDNGATVVFPNSGSQPRWDFELNSVPTQVKTVSSYSSVTTHLQKNPNIPVIVNADAENIPESVETITVPELASSQLEPGQVVAVKEHSLDAIESSAQDGVDSYLGGVGKFNIPIVTVALSSFRELNLLFSDETDLESAFKNISLDVVGTSVGLFTGTKIGAKFGAAIGGPVGMVVGGVIGGAVGAISGRKLTDSIKHENLREKLSNLELQLSDLSKCKTSLNRTLGSKIKEANSRLSSRHKKYVKEICDQVNKPSRKLIGLQTRYTKEVFKLYDKKILEMTSFGLSWLPFNRGRKSFLLQQGAMYRTRLERFIKKKNLRKFIEHSVTVIGPSNKLLKVNCKYISKIRATLIKSANDVFEKILNLKLESWNEAVREQKKISEYVKKDKVQKILKKTVVVYNKCLKRCESVKSEGKKLNKKDLVNKIIDLHSSLKKSRAQTHKIQLKSKNQIKSKRKNRKKTKKAA